MRTKHPYAHCKECSLPNVRDAFDTHARSGVNLNTLFSVDASRNYDDTMKVSKPPSPPNTTHKIAYHKRYINIYIYI